MDKEKVAVLLSTYNGGGNTQYLRKQLDSILKQKNVEVTLYIRDDKSKDDTGDILKEYAATYGNIVLLESDENLGACRSFLKLICTEINTEFFALADQDDVWDEDKLFIGIEMLKTLPQDKPALYYSNARVTDAEGNVTRLAHSHPQVAKNKWAFLAEPLAQGCTCIYNREIAKIAWQTHPTTYSMHDTYIYNVGAMFGNVIYDFEPHMNYRLHEANVIGASKKKISFDGLKRQFHYFFNWKDQPRYETALIMKESWSGLMDEDQKKMVSMITDYKKSIRNRIRLFRCKEMYPETKYRVFRWRTKVLLGNI